MVTSNIDLGSGIVFPCNCNEVNTMTPNSLQRFCYFKYFHVALVVLDYLLGLDLLAAHHLDHEVGGGEQLGAERLDLLHELLVHLLDVALELGVGGHVAPGVRHQEVGHLGEAGGEPLPERLQLGVHLVIYSQTLLQDIRSSRLPVLLLIRILEKKINLGENFKDSTNIKRRH